ncbi:MAG: orotate phosphoribosyltransferase, partial [Sphingobacteriales bacterium]
IIAKSDMELLSKWRLNPSEWGQVASPES